MLLEKESGDEEPREDEEQVDAVEAAGEPEEVVGDDEKDGEATNPVEGWDMAEARIARHRRMISRLFSVVTGQRSC